MAAAGQASTHDIMFCGLQKDRGRWRLLLSVHQTYNGLFFVVTHPQQRLVNKTQTKPREGEGKENKDNKENNGNKGPVPP